MVWVFVISLVVILLIAYEAYGAKNYLDPSAPFYSGNYAVQEPGPLDNLTVLSYNLGYALNIDQASMEIKQLRSQKGLDILLLQEMDEVGIERIAKDLQFNYVYYPAAVEPTYHKNFGNAVLSRWPIVDSRKLILPHKSFSNRMSRVATRATIQIHGEEILAYSIHTEPVFTLPHHKVDQYMAILNNVDSEAKRVIIGGDFNTFAETAIEKMVRQYSRAGLERVSVNIGYTFVRWGLEMSPDHIFAKGFAVKEKSKLAEATASDHLPIWVTLVQK